MPATTKAKTKRATKDTENPKHNSEIRIPYLDPEHVRRFRVAVAYNGDTAKKAFMRLTTAYIEKAEAQMRKEMFNEPKSK